MTVPHCGTAPNIPYPGVTGIRQVRVPLQKRRCSGSEHRQIKRKAEHQKACAELSPPPLNYANSFQHKGSIKKIFPTGITEGWMPQKVDGHRSQSLDNLSLYFKPQAQRRLVGELPKGIRTNGASEDPAQSISGCCGGLSTTVATGMRPRLKLGLVG